MKILKWLLILIVIAVVLIGAAVGFFISKIDSVAKTALEQGGTYAMGVETKVESVDVGLRAGTFDLAGLKVSNPSGFKEATFLTLGKGGVSVKYESLEQPVVELPRFALSDLTVNLEKSGGTANYNTILDNLKKLSSGSETSKPKPAGEQPKFIIREVSITDVTVNADMLGLGTVSPRISIPIHELKLKDVGQGQGGVKDSGVTLEQLASLIVQAVLSAAVDSGGLPTEMLGDLQGQLAQLGDLKNVGVEVVGKLGETAKQLQGSIQDVTKGVEDITNKGKDAVDSVKKGLEGLIPGKK